MIKAIKKPSLGTQAQSSCEGSLALTSDQMLDCEKYLKRRHTSTDLYRFDGVLYDVLQEIFTNDSSVLQAMADSVQDEHCTKQFVDWSNTFDQFDHFLAEERKNALWQVNVRVGCALVKEMLNIHQLQPVEVTGPDDMLKVFTNLKASAGLASYGRSKRDSISDCFSTANRIKSLIRKGEPFSQIYLPAMVFHRAQISGFIVNSLYVPELLKRKDRFVWGIDGGTVGVEAPYAKPIIDHVSRLWTGYVGGKRPESLRRSIYFARKNNFYWTSVDFSLFDQTVPSWLIQWCFSCIKEFYGAQYHDDLDWVCYNFINTRVAIPGRGICQKHHGIPSGSNFTQLVGSMVNAVVILSYIASRSPGRDFQSKIDYVREQTPLDVSFRERSIFVMGDDDLVFTQSKLNLQKLAEYADHIFGMRINPDKCHQGDRDTHPIFLKREWRRGGEYQDPRYLCVNVMHPEHDRKYDNYSPWHILYGLFLTYRFAFPAYLSEEVILRKMESHGAFPD